MDIVTLDFETYFDEEYTLKKLTTEAYIRDERFQAHGCGVKMNNEPTRWVQEDDLKEFFKRAKKKLESSAVLMHHAHFDGLILSHHYGIRPKRILCTLSMARPMADPLISRSLDSLLQHYRLGMKFGGGEILNRIKGKRKLSYLEMSELARYCCDDVEGTRKLFDRFVADGFPKQEMRHVDWTVRMFTEPMLEIDTALLEDYLMEIQANKRMHLISAGVDEKTIMSDGKFADALRALNVEPPTKLNAKGIVSYAFAKTDEAMKLLAEHPDERVQALVAARLHNKSTINETRSKRLIDMASRGPACIYSNYCGAETTYRHSGGDKMNFLNLPRGGTMRKALVAPEGYVVVVTDSAAIEARTVDWLAMQMDSVERFRNDEDQYCYIAAELFGRPINKEDDPEERFLGKTIKLGCGYGMGYAKFQFTCQSKGVKISEDTALRAVETYRRTHAKVVELWERAQKAIPQMIAGNETAVDPHGLIHTVKDALVLPNGFRIKYPNLRVVRGPRGVNYEYDYREGRTTKSTKIYGGKIVENIVQALARIIVMDQTAAVNTRHPVKMSTYDEIVAVVPEDEAKEAMKFMIETMRIPPAWCGDLPLNAEGGFARRYGDAKK